MELFLFGNYEIYFCLPPRPDRLWSPSNLICSGYRG